MNARALDSVALRPYPLWMHIRGYRRLAVSALLSVVMLSMLPWQALPAASAPALLVLEYTVGGKKASVNVEARREPVASPTHGIGVDKITILPGVSVSSTRPLSDVRVEFYNGTLAQPILLYAIGIRYFKNADGLWLPRYQLIEDVLVMRGADGNWKPLAGAPAALVVTSSTLPNTEGFYPALEFGSGSGALHVDFWLAREQPATQ